jgi:hypothetical protein
MGTVEEKLINNKKIFILRDFLDKDFFEKLQKFILSGEINWFYREKMTRKYNDNSFFTHVFFANSAVLSDFYIPYILPIVEKLNFLALNEASANLLLNKGKVYQSNFHEDRQYLCKTAVFYINTCNGYTIFDKEENFISKCEENKMVVFDSNLEHSVVSQTDTDQRVVLNFNGF